MVVVVFVVVVDTNTVLFYFAKLLSLRTIPHKPLWSNAKKSFNRFSFIFFLFFSAKDQVSISPTFYARLFRFFVLRFKVCTFFGAKISAQKLLVICW
jgi:hypothetical protein